jgi:acetolactate synthase-1/2/3 large subunit
MAMCAARVTSPEAFLSALERALGGGGPYVIEIDVPKDSETDPWAFVHPAKP